MLIDPDVHRSFRIRKNREASRKLIEGSKRILLKGTRIKKDANRLIEFSRIIKGFADASKL